MDEMKSEQSAIMSALTTLDKDVEVLTSSFSQLENRLEGALMQEMATPDSTVSGGLAGAPTSISMLTNQLRQLDQRIGNLNGRILNVRDRLEL